MRIRTFLDAGVLIAAFSSRLPLKTAVLRCVNDPDRAFVASPFLRLELQPKPIYHGEKEEVAGYRTYFEESVHFMADDLQAMVEIAQDHAEKFGLSAIDALHLAAAFLMQAEEFVTTESPTKPIYRTNLVRVVQLAESGE